MRIPRLRSSEVHGPLRLLVSPADALATWLEKLIDIQVVDRAVAIGALAFSALFPLLILYSALAPHSDAQDFANQIIEWLHLKGASAESVRMAFAPPKGVTGGFTAVGALLALVSSLSFARALQRLYERCYELPTTGIRDTPWHLLWIVLIPVYVALRPLVASIGSGWWHVAGSLLLGVIAWLLTPYIVLGRRVPWRRLLPGAVMTALAMIALAGVSLIYVPISIESSASQYGTLGVAFALLGWLVLAGFVLVGSAAAGAALPPLISRSH